MISMGSMDSKKEVVQVEILWMCSAASLEVVKDSKDRRRLRLNKSKLKLLWRKSSLERWLRSHSSVKEPAKLVKERVERTLRCAINARERRLLSSLYAWDLMLTVSLKPFAISAVVKVIS